jgi:hypothetical protein
MTPKREAEKKEALGHLVYFQEMLFAQEQAAKRMEDNIKICRKNVKVWEGRIAKMEQSTRPKGERGGA